MNLGLFHSYDDTVYVATGGEELGLAVGDRVVFSHGGATCLGRVVFLDKTQLTENEIALDGQLLRAATDADAETYAANKSEAARLLERAQARLTEIGSPLRFSAATLRFDGEEIELKFYSEERVDFREIVPKLAGALKKRIRLTQLGPRDRARDVGGYGICGRQQCCTAGVVKKFKTITLEMARKQELIMKGPDKLSGNCGKLLCCLGYEVELYAELRRGLPKYGARVSAPQGEGKVIGLSVLDQMVKIYFDVGGVATLPAGELRPGRPAAPRPERPTAKPVRK